MQRIEISINGERRAVDTPAKLIEVLEVSGFTAEGAAIAVNESVVPRAEHAALTLQDGDRVHVVASAAPTGAADPATRKELPAKLD